MLNGKTMTILLLVALILHSLTCQYFHKPHRRSGGSLKVI